MALFAAVITVAGPAFVIGLVLLLKDDVATSSLFFGIAGCTTAFGSFCLLRTKDRHA